jgi:hypothetical protein
MPASEMGGRTPDPRRHTIKTVLEKIAIFGLLTIAAISVAAVVLPRIPMDIQVFSAPADAEPFIGQ